LAKEVEFLDMTSWISADTSCFTELPTNYVAQLFEALRFKPEGRGLDSRWGSFVFFIDLILPAALLHYGTRDIFWRVKAAGQ
jgi:hypothetical protein